MNEDFVQSPKIINTISGDEDQNDDLSEINHTSSINNSLDKNQPIETKESNNLPQKSIIMSYLRQPEHVDYQRNCSKAESNLITFILYLLNL